VAMHRIPIGTAARRWAAARTRRVASIVRCVWVEGSLEEEEDEEEDEREQCRNQVNRSTKHSAARLEITQPPTPSGPMKPIGFVLMNSAPPGTLKSLSMRYKPQLSDFSDF